MFLSPFLPYFFRGRLPLSTRLGNPLEIISVTAPVPKEKIKHPEFYSFISLLPCTNSDYHHNPFVPDPVQGKDHYPGLKSGIYLSQKKIPFEIPGSYLETGRPSVVTTGENMYFSCTLPLAPSPTKSLQVALGGAWMNSEGSRAARLEIHYGDGEAVSKIVKTNQDVWSY